MGDAAETLQWPPSATAEEKATWKPHLLKVNGYAQAILDEFQAANGKSAIQKRTGYVMRLVSNAEKGIFVPDQGKAIAAARERNRQATAPRTQGNRTPPTSPGISATAEAMRARVEGRAK